MIDNYDVIIVGTGFASSFFLWSYLQTAGPAARVLVLERGRADSKAWQLEHRLTSSINPKDVFKNNNPGKDWYTSPGFGGNSKCWLGGTTRMMPGDFALRTRYGVGYDWPMSYDELEQHYCTVEEIMRVSGPADSPMPRSRPLPLPPHRLSDPETLLKKHFPEGWYTVSTARASAPTGTRGVCCATGSCELCPVDAKFTIQNGLAHIYADSRVQLLLSAEVTSVDTSAGRASGVTYLRAGRAERSTADLIVLGASALFNPHILLRSGITHPLLGKRLHEQYAVDLNLNLRGVKAFNGSTIITGLGYLFYEGEHRRDHAACLIETWNSPFIYRGSGLRAERGRWTERLLLRCLFDDIPRDDNTVTVNAENPALAETSFNGYSDYAYAAAKKMPAFVDKLAEALPIEGIDSTAIGRTAAHIQGTVVMGTDPATSIVDRYLVHHQYRNLVVLGCSSYPTASPAYPTLTVSALSLWSAAHLFGTKAD